MLSVQSSLQANSLQNQNFVLILKLLQTYYLFILIEIISINKYIFSFYFGSILY